MISSYNKETRVYTCHFTRDEFNTLLDLVNGGVCSYHGLEWAVNMEQFRTLRDELNNSWYKL